MGLREKELNNCPCEKPYTVNHHLTQQVCDGQKDTQDILDCANCPSTEFLENRLFLQTEQYWLVSGGTPLMSILWRVISLAGKTIPIGWEWLVPDPKSWSSNNFDRHVEMSLGFSGDRADLYRLSNTAWVGSFWKVLQGRTDSSDLYGRMNNLLLVILGAFFCMFLYFLS